MDQALREALSAIRDAWTEVDDSYPYEDEDGKAVLLQTIDNAILEIEEAIRLACISTND